MREQDGHMQRKQSFCLTGMECMNGTLDIKDFIPFLHMLTLEYNSIDQCFSTLLSHHLAAILSRASYPQFPLHLILMPLKDKTLSDTMTRMLINYTLNLVPSFIIARAVGTIHVD